MSKFKYIWRLHFGWFPIQPCTACWKWYYGGLPFDGWEAAYQEYCSTKCHHDAEY